MNDSIKRDEHIRLKNGKLMLLDASRLENGKYEVMLLNPRTGAEVDGATVRTEAEALVEFDRLRKKYHTPDMIPQGMTNSYKKLIDKRWRRLKFRRTEI